MLGGVHDAVLVLDGHLPARKGHHFAAVRDMVVVQRRALQRPARRVRKAASQPTARAGWRHNLGESRTAQAAGHSRSGPHGCCGAARCATERSACHTPTAAGHGRARRRDSRWARSAPSPVSCRLQDLAVVRGVPLPGPAETCRGRCQAERVPRVCRCPAPAAIVRCPSCVALLN